MVRRGLKTLRKSISMTDWPDNGLRHSLATYHYGFFLDAQRLAKAMGHEGTLMIHDSYVRPLVEGVAVSAWR